MTTSKILSNVIPSRSSGDISKLFWTYLFVQVFFWPNSFLLLFSTSLSALSPGVLVWFVGGFFCYGLVVGWLGFCVWFFVCVWVVFLVFFNFPFAFLFFFSFTIAWLMLLLVCFVYVFITNFSLCHREQLIKVSIWD